MASDIHLGTIMGSRRLETIVARINALEPDIVLLPGDIVDESVSIAEEEKMISVLRSIRAPLGVFSVPGNHEYFGGLAKNLEYLVRGGVRVLQDEAVTVGGAFVLAGRKDPTALRFGESRKALPEILESAGVDRTLPIILLDHQPLRLNEAEDAGVDLQLSGHTHAGQLFPLNLINKMIYEQYWGYLRKGTDPVLRFLRRRHLGAARAHRERPRDRPARGLLRPSGRPASGSHQGRIRCRIGADRPKAERRRQRAER